MAPSATSGTHDYIRNLTQDALCIEKHLMGWSGNGELNNSYWATWVRDAWNNPHTYDLVKRYMHRPPEQLYDTAKDPYEMNNLIDDPKLAKVKTRLTAELDRWMKAQSDPGAPQDTHEAHAAAKRGEHMYGPGISN